MKYLSVCSGIEAASVAWHRLGWEPVGFSEIEPFPSKVLAHHYPQTPNLGDMTKYKEWNLGAIDVLVGGTPCQSFSVAGLRKGLEDPRGNLALVYCGILDHFRPQWFVWENVPGVLSSNGGRDFGSFLGALAQPGYGFAYRVLDAQYFGVAQRRRRVFVVGCLGDWKSAASVLFEPNSLRRDTAPSRKTGEEVAGTITRCAFSGGASGKPDGAAVGHFITMAHGQGGAEIGFDRGPTLTCNHEAPILAFPSEMSGTQAASTENLSPCLSVKHTTAVAQPIVGALACNTGPRGHDAGNFACNQAVDAGHILPVLPSMAVRRLTPVECERLQGFPDGYTDIQPNGKPTPDGPRYKALGNSMAVPVMQWIGTRIQQVNAALEAAA